MTTPTTCPGCGRQTESSLPACQFCNFRWAVWNRAAPPASAPASAAVYRLGAEYDAEHLTGQPTRRIDRPAASAPDEGDRMRAPDEGVFAVHDFALRTPPDARAPDALTLETLDEWERNHAAIVRDVGSAFAALIAFARERLTAEVTP